MHDFPGQTPMISPWIFPWILSIFQVFPGENWDLPGPILRRQLEKGYDLLCIEGLVRALQVFKGVTWSQRSHGKPWEALVIP